MKEPLQILIVDDDRRMAKTLADILRVKGYAAEVAHSGSEALEKVEGAVFPFDCVLSDIKMPKVNGVELFHAIKAVQPDLPVVLMTAYSADTLVKEGLEAGVVAILTKPLDIGHLLSFFSLLRKERSVVIVDDDPQFGRTLGDILRARGFAVSHITRPEEAVEQVGGEAQVVLLDMKLNSVGGLHVLRAVRQRHPHLPVILVTGYRSEMASAIEAALEISAYTCLYKPLEIETLLHVLSEIHRRQLGRALGQVMPKK